MRKLIKKSTTNLDIKKERQVIMDFVHVMTLKKEKLLKEQEDIKKENKKETDKVIAIQTLEERLKKDKIDLKKVIDKYQEDRKILRLETDDLISIQREAQKRNKVFFKNAENKHIETLSKLESEKSGIETSIKRGEKAHTELENLVNESMIKHANIKSNISKEEVRQKELVRSIEDKKNDIALLDHQKRLSEHRLKKTEEQVYKVGSNLDDVNTKLEEANLDLIKSKNEIEAQKLEIVEGKKKEEELQKNMFKMSKRINRVEELEPEMRKLFNEAGYSNVKI